MIRSHEPHRDARLRAVVVAIMIVASVCLLRAGKDLEFDSPGSVTVGATKSRNRHEVPIVSLESDREMTACNREPLPAGIVDAAPIRIVQVVDQRDGRPVPGAEVLCLPVGEDLGSIAHLADRRGLSVDAMRRGQSCVSDRAGRAQLEGVSGFMFVRACLGTRVGRTTVLPHEREATVQLVEVERISVRVVDGQNAPVANVPVVILRQGSNAMRQVVSRTWSGADGVGVFEEVAIGRQDDAHLIAVDMLGNDRAEVAVDACRAEQLSNRVYDLQMPPHGTLVVCREPTAVVGACRLTIAGKPGTTSSPRIDPVMRLWGSGESVFEEFVGLGLVLDVAVEGSPISASVNGPTQIDQRCNVLLHRDPGSTLMSGQVLTPDGEPIRNERIGISCEGYQSTIAADANGRIMCSVPASTSKSVAFMRDKDGTMARGDVLIAVAGAQSFDFGVVRLVQLVPDFSGRVIDDKGVGLSDVVLQFERVDGASTTVISGKDGWFHAYVPDASADRRPWTIRVIEGGTCEEKSTLPGKQDIEVRLARGFDLCGSAFPTDLAADPRVTWMLFKDAGTGPPGCRSRLWLRTSASHDGKFCFRHLTPGQYTLQVVAEPDGEPLFRIANLVLGPHTSDAQRRLQDIDLSRFLARVDLEAVDRSGAPVPDACAWLASPAGGRGYRVPSVVGRLRLLSARGRSALVVTAGPRPPQRVLIGSGMHRVVLDDGLSIDVRWDINPRSSAQMGSLPIEIAIAADPGSDRDLRSWVDITSLKLARSIDGHTVLPGAGRYRFRIAGREAASDVASETARIELRLGDGNPEVLCFTRNGTKVER